MFQFTACLVQIVILLAFVGSTCVYGQTVFQDDFSGGKSPRWKQRNDGFSPGQFQVRDGNYVLISNDSAKVITRSIVSDLLTENYFLQAEVHATPVKASFSQASLLSYYSDSTHYYELALDPGQNYWSLQKMDKTGSTLLARGPSSSSRKIRRLGLYVKDGDIRAFLDGVLVGKVADPVGLPPGGFGLSACGAEARWDNVQVKVSNPQDFSYNILARTTRPDGRAAFSNIVFKVTGTSNNPLSGIRTYRVFRDGVSYFVFHDRSLYIRKH